MIPTTIRAVGTVALACAMLAGCGDRAPKQPKMADVFPNLPLPPEASLVGKSGGPEALQLTLRSSKPSAEVEAYYRKVFSANGWRVVNHFKSPEGATVFLAQQDGPPLWVRIMPADSSTTMVELAGAVMERRDTTKVRKSAS
jgi:hypothetical protein